MKSSPPQHKMHGQSRLPNRHSVSRYFLTHISWKLLAIIVSGELIVMLIFDVLGLDRITPPVELAMLDPFFLTLLVAYPLYLWVLLPLHVHMETTNDEFNLLSEAMNQSGEAIMITSRDGHIVYANAEFSRLMRVASGALIGRMIHEYEPHMAADWQRAFLDCVVRRGEVWREEVKEKQRNGEKSVQVIDYSTSAIRRHGRITHFVTVKRDISNQRDLEKQLQQAQKMEVVGTLSGGIAHNFNNMLAALSGNVYLLRAMFGRHSGMEKAHTKLDAMDNVIMRASEHIRGLLSFARKGRMDASIFPLGPLIKETIKLATISVPENIRLQTDISDEAMLVNADATQLQQAVLNLINNAVHALEGKEQGLIRMSMERMDLNGGQGVCISVSDNGCGIPRHLLKMVCDPYFTTKPQGKGTGLGLAMASGMVEQCHGKFSIDSRSGEGTTIRLHLPLVESSERKQSVQDLPEATGDMCGKGECILWVDDDDDVRDTGIEVLRSTGFNVISATNGKEALSIFLDRRSEITGVVMDVIMPEMGGVEAARRMREVSPSLPVILISGYDISGESETACNQGICDHLLRKPVDFAKLSAMLAS